MNKQDANLEAKKAELQALFGNRSVGSGMTAVAGLSRCTVNLNHLSRL
jgi:hypothetical protein